MLELFHELVRVELSGGQRWLLPPASASYCCSSCRTCSRVARSPGSPAFGTGCSPPLFRADEVRVDRKSTRLNSSHGYISYAVFCLKKKNSYSIAIGMVCISQTT